MLRLVSFTRSVGVAYVIRDRENGVQLGHMFT